MLAPPGGDCALTDPERGGLSSNMRDRDRETEGGENEKALIQTQTFHWDLFPEPGVRVVREDLTGESCVRRAPLQAGVTMSALLSTVLAAKPTPLPAFKHARLLKPAVAGWRGELPTSSERALTQATWPRPGRCLSLACLYCERISAIWDLLACDHPLPTASAPRLPLWVFLTFDLPFFPLGFRCVHLDGSQVSP